ncbi:MAG: 50S ribosomal protein L6 [Clostridia bacterium]|nr:50S ribosomal protein L6 [Clostridia bacterium]
MSRIGREPVAIPAGVTVEVNNELITVKGPLGTLTQPYDSKAVTITVEGSTATVTRTSDLGPVRAKHGLYRVLLSNMIVGVTKGYEKGLIVNGVGWKVAMQGKTLVMNVGFSKAVEMVCPEGLTITCPSQTEISVKGIDKVLVGQVAANIRAIRRPEPYHGYGIRYKDEVIVRKEGKTAGK